MKTLIFDMYGVIIEESKGNFLPYTYGSFDESRYDHITRMIRQERLFDKAQLGELSSDGFLSALGFDDTERHMRTYLEEHLTLDKGFIPFAQRWREGYELALLSNDVSEWSAYLTRYHGLDEFFSHKIVSGDVHCKKPDERIFRLAPDIIGRAPEDCIFIDNSVKNLLAAERLGMSTVLFNRDGEEYCGDVVYSFEELSELLEKKS